MRFVDLFSGLGGFHIGLSRLGHQCVFASEIDPYLQDLYEKNFGLRPHGDIRDIPVSSIPEHEILCAGSPCQPFSKAGGQQGLDCPKWGDLFEYVVRILRSHKPEYVILENVPNLERHEGGNTWLHLKRRLTRSGYQISTMQLSPHDFGIPQIRNRVFIVGRRSGLGAFAWPERNTETALSIKAILDVSPQEALAVPPQMMECLRVWQRFLRLYPKSEELPSFPIWSMEFGADYPFEEETPFALGTRRLLRYRGSHGVQLSRFSPAERMAHLPSYARVEEETFPQWKVDFIRQNRELYRRHRSLIDPWLPDILDFFPSQQKLEWNCKGEERNIWRYVIQFRASGVRIKRPTSAPSLVAMNTTQVPIIGWERRFMTPRECARLQSLHELQYLPDANRTRASRALGNAVNADVVQRIGAALIGPAKDPTKPSTKTAIGISSSAARHVIA